MTKARCSVVLGLTLLATGLALAVQTTTEFEGKTDFKKYKTWSWGPGGTAANPANEKRVREDVEAQLQAKGWTKIPEGVGDAVVAAHGAVKDTDSIDVLYSGWAPGWGWAGVGIVSGGGTTVQTRIRSGTLIVDIFDAATKKLIWRGTAEDTMGTTADVNLKKIDQAVEKLFKRFPPQPIGQ